MNPQDRFWKVASLVGILLAVFLAVLSIKGLITLNDRDPVYDSISVTGKGEMVVIPNIATFSFGVSEKAKTVKEAQDAASAKINSALAAVRDLGIAEKDIETVSYYINPSYEYTGSTCNEFRCTPGKQTLVGYEVSQTVQVKIRDISKAGEVLSAIGALNVQNASGLSFSVDDIESVKAQAREKAIEDAKVKAKQLSKQLGVRTVKITSFYDSSDQPIWYARDGMGGDMAVSAKVLNTAPAPELPTGEQKVVSTVTITYEIK